MIEIYQTFADRSSSDNSDRLWLLTRLFFAVASQDAFVQLQNSCLTIRESTSTVILPSSNTVSANMESLDQLDVSLTAFVVKRFHLIGLVEARMQPEQTRLRRNEGTSFCSCLLQTRVRRPLNQIQLSVGCPITGTRTGLAIGNVSFLRDFQICLSARHENVCMYILMAMHYLGYRPLRSAS